MSGWRIVVRRLHEAGPQTVPQLETAIEGMFDVYSALEVAQGLALVSHGAWLRGHRYSQWSLTPLGLAFAEGRVAVKQRDSWRRGTRRGRPPTQFVATWLASLPRDIRIEAANEARALKTG